jgi:hypothetical protein
VDGNSVENASTGEACRLSGFGYRGEGETTTKGSAMADDMRVTNFPDGGSAERVALDLADRIAARESGMTKDRAYYLSLYAECLRVVKDGSST